MDAVKHPAEFSRQYRWQQRKRAQSLCTICGKEPIWKGQRCQPCYIKFYRYVKVA